MYPLVSFLLGFRHLLTCITISMLTQKNKASHGDHNCKFRLVKVLLASLWPDELGQIQIVKNVLMHNIIANIITITAKHYFLKANT